MQATLFSKVSGHLRGGVTTATAIAGLKPAAYHPLMPSANFINSNPNILGGTPVFAITRVPVRILFEFIETGGSLAEFLDEFPSVSLELAQGVLQRAKQAVTAAHAHPA